MGHGMTHYFPPMDLLDVVHLDHEILVVNKPSGLLSVPGRGALLADCLITRIQSEYPTALLVHRLDRDTSGVMVFALSPNAQRHLGLQFEKRHTKKTYVARVWGQIEADTGTVDLPIIVDWPNRPKQMICHETGRAALTDWQVINRDRGETRVKLSPKTGRSHQLRIHMLALGHPILGDPFYGTPESQEATRLMLHSHRLRLRHPDGGEMMDFRAKLPF
ncbi:MAG: tRNA pseudouridine32 synthase/23S rRNA pseudouridine746 synthase [Planktomarina sp.]|jgi:tRNA pseudouridine32 synthase/23S rRNA pseudouridine746 synthase